MWATGGSRLVSVAALQGHPKAAALPVARPAPTSGPGQWALSAEHPPHTPLPPQGLLAAWPASQAPWRRCRRLPPAHPDPGEVLDTSLPCPETGSRIPVPGPHRLELGPPPAECPLTNMQPGASPGPPEGPHPAEWGGEPHHRHPHPGQGEGEGLKEGGEPQGEPRGGAGRTRSDPHGSAGPAAEGFVPHTGRREQGSPAGPQGPRACSPSVGLCGHLVVDSRTCTWPA